MSSVSSQPAQAPYSLLTLKTLARLHDDFYQAAQVLAELDWANTTDTSANLFETTIRHLGGLLSAYDLSNEHALLRKAKELGDMLYMAFDTPNGIPGTFRSRLPVSVPTNRLN